jgi:hypothetical protein
MPRTTIVLQRKKPLPELSNGSMFGDGVNKVSAQTRVVGDSDSVIGPEPRTEVDMRWNDFLLLFSPIIIIPQLEPAMALEAVSVFFTVRTRSFVTLLCLRSCVSDLGNDIFPPKYNILLYSFCPI